MLVHKLACLVLPNAVTNHLFCYVLDDFSSWQKVPISQSIDMRKEKLFLGNGKVLAVLGGCFLSRGCFASMAPRKRTAIYFVFSGIMGVIRCSLVTYFSNCRCNTSVVVGLHRELNREVKIGKIVHWLGSCTDPGNRLRRSQFSAACEYCTKLT
jgi:hypothetical protein